MSWEHEGGGDKPIISTGTQLFMDTLKHTHYMSCHYLNAACVRADFGDMVRHQTGILIYTMGTTITGVSKMCEDQGIWTGGVE